MASLERAPGRHGRWRPYVQTQVFKVLEHLALAPITGEVHHVVFVDGIYLARNVVVLIACTQEHVIGWYLARSENSRSWAALMGKIPPPDVVVCDGGTGFEKARQEGMADNPRPTLHLHAFCQVRAQTTSRPKLQAGVELYGLAKELLAIKEVASALAWLEAYSAWCSRWEGFPRRKDPR